MNSRQLSDYIKVRQDSWRGYIQRDFADLEPGVLAGETPLDSRRSALERVASSHTAEVFRYAVQAGGRSYTLYLKKFPPRSPADWFKHLFRPSRAQRAFRAGLLLRQYGFGTPPIAACLCRKKGLLMSQYILITQEMKQAHPLYLALESLCGLQDKRRLIAELGRTIGRMHAAGITHGDLRGGNVFVSQQAGPAVFFFIDNERTVRYPILPGWLRIKNLVQLNMLEKNITSSDRMRFLKAYAAAAGLKKRTMRRLARAVIRKTQRRLRHRAKTRLGYAEGPADHWNFQRTRWENRRGTFRMDFCKGTSAVAFLREIDNLTEHGVLLKNDTAARVVRCTYNNRDIVIKRYNHQGLWHSLRYTFKGSRAKKCWRFGHRLTEAGIACAAPLACIEQYQCGLIWTSYIVNAFVEGPLLYDVMNRPGYSPQEKDAVMQQARQLLEDLGRHRLTHADMKPANLIIHHGKPVLIDLDAMQEHRMRLFFQYRYKKMVHYFHCRLHGKKRQN
ncbi:MAG TPA: lipopolysaccharide kinase InaA family protein [Anaerohalosphaeraceae bacterium]|nr:lipopolysaccharide kinase InaA family protein [Anaerohalosphaeraceae bacterium]HOL30522.1 lipopolysaccharide kinase InaA family protein [Anaerohalosphaeraceae bacterium]HOM75227.1 lipopolysaccharide kinase InaA family protein [Anaerohalosphaeraceae bacterium]HPC63980.1 lipopolysaccharide kinase InaA family protein [Anaerohalosphaeraceae bacterium]HPO70867.1 lipopolysaccharide kinase InaA family protein [Anaerohalosphaeraceae bacterium]